MQKTIQYRAWRSTTANDGSGIRRPRLPAADHGDHKDVQFSGSDDVAKNVGSVTKLVEENAIIVFARRGCCMCHVVKSLLQGLGVNPTIFDVDDQNEGFVIEELSRITGGGGSDGGGISGGDRPQFPAVFVGGKLFGGLERVMNTHISGELVPMLRDAGALWL